MIRILITGPQGCGKTTQVKLIAEKLGLCMVKTGDLIRKFIQENQNSELGKSVKESLDKGLLVDNEIVAQLVEQELSHERCQRGFVVDGYPRTPFQLAVFDPPFDKVFYLDISDEEATKRLLARGRTDDTPEVIKERLEWYHQETEQVLEHYRNLGKLVKINGEQELGVVTKDILQHLVPATSEILQDKEIATS